MGLVLSERLRQSTFETCEQEALLNLFVSTSHVRQRLNALLGEYGVTLTQYNVLRILKGVHPDGHPRCEIIARMVEPAPDVTRLINRLEKSRLVGRAGSNRDGRMSLARITSKGIRLLEEIHTVMNKAQQELLDRFSHKECLELSRLCEKIYS
jgi:DNA-binding MarR family transcriptional regulator